MEREQFTFYKSFWEALKALPKKDQLPFVMAVCSYAFGEESKALTGQASAAFLLVKPILDKASKKAANGKQGGSKPKANRKQNESNIEGEKEGEKEREIEIENECYPPTPFGDVMKAYLDMNPDASPDSIDQLKGYMDQMGPECCLRAISIARDEKKPVWSFVRGILRNRLSAGVRSIADWDEMDRKREEEKKRGTAQTAGGDTDGSFHGWRAKSALDD